MAKNIEEELELLQLMDPEMASELEESFGLGSLYPVGLLASRVNSPPACAADPEAWGTVVSRLLEALLTEALHLDDITPGPQDPQVRVR